jgi:hypothetical protein
MNLMRTKGAVLLLTGIAAFTIPGEMLYASCGAAPIIHNLFSTTWFSNCGPAPTAYAWAHKRGVQRIIGSATTSGNTNAGHDSGNKQSVGDGMLLATLDGTGNPIPGAYQGQTDFSNTEWDGCASNPGLEEGALGCNLQQPDFAPVNYAIGGVDPLAPNVAKLAVLSADYNEFFGAWVLDNAGALPADGDPCGGDAFAANAAPVDCAPIPVPQITGTGTCTAAGCNISIGSASVASLVGGSILDDCAVAETDALNCPRNLYQGRVILFKHGACTPATGAAFNRRAWTYPTAPASGTLVVAGNFTVFSSEDADLDGVLDPGEDGVGGAVNGRLDPFLIPGTAVASTSIFVPAVPTLTDCIFLGMGILLDAGGGSINPPTNTIFGEPVVSPMVSVNNNPIRAGSATPVSDLVTTILATKLPQGKGKVDWSTGIEMTTSGFNVIGTKKGGGEVKLNPSLIEAQEGTTGKGATYTVTFEPGQLKGSSSVYVEIVKTNGSKERFGPASF